MQQQQHLSPGQVAWGKFKQNRWAMVSLWFLVLVLLLAVFAYLVMPDNSPDANQQTLQIGAQKPGFSVTVAKIPKPQADAEGNFLTGYSMNYTLLPYSSYTFNTKGDSIIFTEYTGDSLLIGRKRAYATALFNTQVKDIPLNYCHTKTYWLGTDRFGRDILSRLLLGARVSMLVGFIAVALSLSIGLVLGMLAGYFGGLADKAIMWFITVVWSIPTILLVIAVSIALGKGFVQVFVAVGLTMWVEVARLVRSQVQQLRSLQYIEATKALGYKTPRVFYKHLLPNLSGPLAVIAAANFSSAILVEAGLSFIGFGVQPPTPSWGSMVRDNYGYLILNNPWPALLPGLCIMLVVLALMFVGNALRDAMDVKE
jgi:peptide/nickel transport system permease protein